MTFKLVHKWILALALVVIGAGVAVAAVNYDPETGGFAGKGDVQQVLGFNNNQLQSQAQNIQFRYSDNVVVEGGGCINPNTGVFHPNDVWRRTSGVSTTIESDARQRNQITGFILGAAGSGGDPVYTDSCGGNREEGPGTVLDILPGNGLEVSINGSDWYPLQ